MKSYKLSGLTGEQLKDKLALLEGDSSLVKINANKVEANKVETLYATTAEDSDTTLTTKSYVDNVNAATAANITKLQEAIVRGEVIAGEAGNATTATYAKQLETGRAIKLSGGVSGSEYFDGSGDVEIAVELNKHVHSTEDITDLQNVLYDKADKDHTHLPAAAPTDEKEGSDGFMSAADKAKLDLFVVNDSLMGINTDKVSVTAPTTAEDSTLTLVTKGYVDAIIDDIDDIIDGTTKVGHAAKADQATDADRASVADEAAIANKLTAPRDINLTGDVTGFVSFDGSQNVFMEATVADNSHNHTIENVTDLQEALNNKADKDHTHDIDDIDNNTAEVKLTGDVTGEATIKLGETTEIYTTVVNYPHGHVIEEVDALPETISGLQSNISSLQSGKSDKGHVHDTAEAPDDENAGKAGFMSAEDKAKLDYTNIAYGTCDTPAGSITKEITIEYPKQGWELKQGSRITVKFTYTNNCGEAKFDVNNTGAKPVLYNNSPVSNNVQYAGYANRLMDFIYDGENWVFMSWSYDTSFIDVISLPQVTATPDPTRIYRVPTGTFIYDNLLRHESICHIGEWDAAPGVVGEDVLLPDGNGGLSFNGYYNVKNNKVYGYIGVYAKTIISSVFQSDSTGIETGWKEIPEITSLTNGVVTWGGLVYSTKDATDPKALYLLLTNELFTYKNGAWINLNTGAIRAGTSAGAEVFNSLDNVASGLASHAEGYKTEATAEGAHAEGRKTKATMEAAHAEGFSTTASNKMAHAEGDQTTASGLSSHAEGQGTYATEINAHAEGCKTEATGAHSHAEGYNTKATNSASHAGGVGTVANGEAQTVIGRYNVADTTSAFIIGKGSKISNTVWPSNAMTVDWNGNAKFAGSITSEVGKISAYNIAGQKEGTALGAKATAEGHNTTASGDYSHAEGFGTTTGFGALTCEGAHAEGYETKAYAKGAHAEGIGTIASGVQGGGVAAHAEGYKTEARGKCSHAAGYYTIANNYQTVIGVMNSSKAGNNDLYYLADSEHNGTAFIIGNGCLDNNNPGTETIGYYSNAFRVDYDGNVYSGESGAYNSGNADYAELFEWVDLNANNEDRRGYFITLDGDKIKMAGPDDYILGIVSSCATVLGNNPEDWNGRYIRDEFGCVILEEYTYEETVIDEEAGTETTVTKTGKRYKQNPDYDPEQAYIERDKRPEWAAVGMLGVLPVRDDGTCKVNGFCTVTEGGIATASETGYRVIKRVNDHIVKVIFR